MDIAENASESILIVDDEQLVRNTLVEQLRHEGYRAEASDSLEAARERMKEAPPSVVLLDLRLPDGNGLDFLPQLRAHWPETAVIVMTGHGSIESAVHAIRLGAHNYVQKPLNFDELVIALRQAIETNRLVQRAEDERRRNADRFSFGRIVAKSDVMKRVVEQTRVVAESRATSVLLLGESGTGKGVIAGALHYASDRSGHPFLKVTCSAIPETLLEAEMFGHERGAFTDAKERRRGVFEAADRGTVLLDEIGDMPQALQAKLLGVIEDRSFSRIGGTRRVEVDVRIVAATHRDLERGVDEGRFREDLFYRLKVVPIVLPALRDRPDDILPLARVFLREFNAEFGRSVAGFDAAAEEHLAGHTWPGNVRELRNVIERAMLFARGDVLSQADLLTDMGYRPRIGGSRKSKSFTLPADGLNLDRLEQDLVRQAMRRADNNQSRAAALLGISRDQIRYRLDKMGLLPKRKGRRDEAEG